MNVDTTKSDVFSKLNLRVLRNLLFALLLVLTMYINDHRTFIY